MTAADWDAILLTLKLALVSTGVLVCLAIPIGYGLFRLHSPRQGILLAEERCKPSRWYGVLRTVIALPLVLPPTVLGFYLIILLAPNSPLVATLGLPSLLFSFSGLVIGSVIYSLPLTVAPIADAFIAIPSRYIAASQSLCLNQRTLLVRVMLPLARRGILSGVVLGFAHTLGEFGVVLMIGGNIPGETRLLSMAIYDHVEALDFAKAHQLALVALVMSFSLLVLAQLLGRNRHD